MGLRDHWADPPGEVAEDLAPGGIPSKTSTILGMRSIGPECSNSSAVASHGHSCPRGSKCKLD